MYFAIMPCTSQYWGPVVPDWAGVAEDMATFNPTTVESVSSELHETFGRTTPSEAFSPFKAGFVVVDEADDAVDMVPVAIRTVTRTTPIPFIRLPFWITEEGISRTNGRGVRSERSGVTALWSN